LTACVLKEPLPETENAPPNSIAPSAVMELESKVLPPPICVSVPAMDPVAPAENVTRPVLVRERDPPPAVVKGLLKVKDVPVSDIPAAAVVFKAPLNVVVPVPFA